MADDRPSYGGGWKRWLWVYLLAAVVVYGLVYVLFLRDGGGGGGGDGGGDYVALIPLVGARRLTR